MICTLHCIIVLVRSEKIRLTGYATLLKVISAYRTSVGNLKEKVLFGGT
jgi:hypothetical protein